jgi:hypothetical protein
MTPTASDQVTITDTPTVGGIIPVAISLTEPYVLAGVAQPITAQEIITTTAEFTAIARGEPPRSAVVSPESVRIVDTPNVGVNPHLVPVAESVTVTATTVGADVGSHRDIIRTETVTVRDTVRVLGRVYETYTPLGGIANDTPCGGIVNDAVSGGYAGVRTTVTGTALRLGPTTLLGPDTQLQSDPCQTAPPLGGEIKVGARGGEVMVDVLAGVY